MSEKRSNYAPVRDIQLGIRKSTVPAKFCSFTKKSHNSGTSDSNDLTKIKIKDHLRKPVKNYLADFFRYGRGYPQFLPLRVFWQNDLKKSAK